MTHFLRAFSEEKKVQRRKTEEYKSSALQPGFWQSIKNRNLQKVLSEADVALRIKDRVRLKKSSVSFTFSHLMSVLRDELSRSVYVELSPLFFPVKKKAAQRNRKLLFFLVRDMRRGIICLICQQFSFINQKGERLTMNKHIHGQTHQFLSFSHRFFNGQPSKVRCRLQNLSK